MNTIKYDYHENHERLKINKSFNIVIMKINNNHNKTLFILLLMYLDIDIKWITKLNNFFIFHLDLANIEEKYQKKKKKIEKHSLREITRQEKR